MIEGVTARVARWRWVVAAVWIVDLGVAAVVSAPLPHLLSGGGWSVEGSDSALVAAELQHGFVGRGACDITVVVHDRWYTAAQPGFDVRVRRVLEDVHADPGLHAVSRVGYSTSRRSGDLHDTFVGRDGRTAIDVLGLDLDDGAARRVLPEVQSRLAARHARNGLDVSLVGTASYWGEVNHLSEKGLLHAELLTLPLILLVLVRLFGGHVAALTALVVGVTAILFSFAVLAVIAAQHELSLFVENTATMLGVGVGIDYSLFVVAPFKEELAAGRTVDEAIRASLRTSGETVLFSGITILAAMSTLFFVPLGVISSIALGAVVVVAFSVLTSLLLLPVLLRLLGHGIHAGRVRFLPVRPRGSHRLPGTARWQRLADRVMGRPLAFLGVGVVALLALAAPAHGLTTFTPDISIVPHVVARPAGLRPAAGPVRCRHLSAHPGPGGGGSRRAFPAPRGRPGRGRPLGRHGRPPDRAGRGPDRTGVRPRDPGPAGGGTTAGGHRRRARALGPGRWRDRGGRRQQRRPATDFRSSWG